MAQWPSAASRQCGRTVRRARRGGGRQRTVTSASRQRGGREAAAPSVATAGRPRLERHCASQPRAPRERDAHTRRPCARPTILALEPSVLIPIYFVRQRSLMFLCDRKRVFNPRASDPLNDACYVGARDRDAAWPFVWYGSFRRYVTIERRSALLFGRERVLAAHSFGPLWFIAPEGVTWRAITRGNRSVAHFHTPSLFHSLYALSLFPTTRDSDGGKQTVKKEQYFIKFLISYHLQYIAIKFYYSLTRIIQIINTD